jgi:hypothetical protein
VILPFVEEVAMSGSITGAKRRRDPEPHRTAARPPPQDPVFHGNLDSLAEVLPQRADLQDIHAVQGNLTPELAAGIARALAEPSALQSLKIDACEADDASLIAVAAALADTASLQTFAIGHTGAVRKWAAALTEALKVNTSLVDLRIEGTIVYANEAAALADAAGRHPTLRRVMLGAMRSPPLETFLEGLSALNDGGLERLTLRALAADPRASCISTLCDLVRSGRVECIEIDTVLKPQSIERLLEALESTACTTALEAGEHLVLSQALQARWSRAQLAAPSRRLESRPPPVIEMQAPVHPVPALPPVVSAMPSLPWRRQAEAHLKNRQLNQFAQAMADGQIAGLTYYLQDLSCLSEALRCVPALTRVRLVNVSVSAAGACEFGAALQKHSTLKALGFTHCRHQPGGFSAMVQALSAYGGLESLKFGVDPDDIVHRQEMQDGVHQLVDAHPGLRKLTLAGEWIDTPGLLGNLLSILRRKPHFEELKLESCPAHLFDSLMEGLRAQAPWRLPTLTLKRVSGDQNARPFDDIVHKLALCPVNKLVIKAVTLSTEGNRKLLGIMTVDEGCRTLIEFSAMNQLAMLSDERCELAAANALVKRRLQWPRNPMPPFQF